MARHQFLIVGIGASAGGVEALQGFFARMPADTGMAFIVVTHLGKDQVSAMPQIIARATSLPIEPIRNGAAVEPNHVYVLSTDAVPMLRRGRLRLAEQRATGRERNTIDVFFTSLAEDREENAVAVILSGAGHDGTLGVKAIKEKGGFAIAQTGDDGAPRYPQMPDSAIASGLIDLKLPVDQMAAKLLEYKESLGALDPERSDADDRGRLDDGHRSICEILHEQTGHDFGGYKQRTFLRRVERRMHVLGVEQIDPYIEILRNDRQEVIALFHDLLIGVTAFFRDREAFDALGEDLMPVLFQGKGQKDPVRVWVPGCSTGEEAYSIAILLIEQMAKMKGRPQAVVFATDIDDPAISVARAGRFPAAMLHDLSPERIDRFFSCDGISYSLTKEVRDLCIFSSHSVIRDPPFSRIDLISCRNLLIYLDRDLQNQLIPVFHYALRPGGYLFLGSSETLTRHADLFNPIDQKHRIFQRRDYAGFHPILPLVVPAGRAVAGVVAAQPRVRFRDPNGLSLRYAVESRVIEQFAPAHVVVTRDGDIVHFSSRTGKYLESAPGAPSRNIAAMARRGLRLDLRTALADAVESRAPVLRQGLHVETEDHVQFLDLRIEPLPDHDTEPLFLILFCDIGGPLSPERRPPAPLNGPDPLASERLEHELRETRERLQSSVEEYETALEELKSANEELVSINEELQSTNEELETSREESQSVNEELHTVNSELQRRLEELNEANDNQRDLFEGTGIGIVVLDRQLLIRSFTPAIRNIFNLVEGDRGRPLTDLVSGIVDLDLHREIEEVLSAGESRERRIVTRDGNTHFLMRVLPYRMADRTVEGVLVTFTDVTRTAEAEEYHQELRQRVETMLRVVLDIAERSLPEGAASVALRNRVRALADTYRLVTDANWASVPLAELVANELADFGIGREGRVAVDGMPVLVRVSAAVMLGMALHELAARAAAEGALSVPQGRVHVEWAIEPADGAERRLVIRWREAGGPAARVPDGADYGRALIESGLRDQIGAAGSMSFGDDGVRAEITLPLAGGMVVLPVGAERE